MVALNGSESLAQAGRELHTTALQWKGKRTHVYTHQGPLSSHPVSPSCPLSPALVWGYSPWKKGESWEDLLSCSLEWTDSGADSVVLGAARRCKERWMSSSDVCWALPGEVSPVIDELTQRPLLRGSNWCALAIKISILSWGSYMLRRKGEEIRLL